MDLWKAGRCPGRTCQVPHLPRNPRPVTIRKKGIQERARDRPGKTGQGLWRERLPGKGLWMGSLEENKVLPASQTLARKDLPEGRRILPHQVGKETRAF